MAATPKSTGADADAQALRAALSTIHDWDAELAELFGLDTSSSSSSDEQPKIINANTVISRRENRGTRANRREEIAALKAQVEELQYQVALQRASGDALLTKADAVKAAEEELEWQKRANSQQKLRFAAELENVNLRRRTKFQLRMSRQIEKLTKRLTHLREFAGVPRGLTVSYYSGSRMDPRDQLKCLDGLLEDASEVFGVDRFARSSRFREMQFRNDTPAEVGVELEYQAVWMLPFAAERVADALWAQTIRPTYEDKTHAYNDVYIEADSTVSQLIATPTGTDLWGPCHHQVAARRLSNGEGSHLIVAKTLGRGINDSKWHTHFNYDTWLSVERVHTPARSSPITIIKFYRRTLLQLPKEVGFSRAERCKWSQTLFTSHAHARFLQDLDWTVQVVDNLLLTPDVATHRTSSPSGLYAQLNTISV